MLGQVTEGTLDLVGAWAWLEGLLYLVLLHFCAETNLCTTDGWAGFVFSRTREEVGLTDTEI